jgi:hypothetical protein
MTVDLTGGVDVVLDDFGESVTYNPLGVSGSAITAVWEPDSEPEELRDDGKWSLRRGLLYCSISDVSSPSNRDTVTIGGEEWQVDDERGIDRDNAGGVTLPLVIKTRLEVSGPEYRRRT